MEVERYRLRCSLPAHSSDIRAIAASFHPDEGLITGSRDKTIKVWKPNRLDNGFVEVHCMHGASNYISSLCALPPSEQYPLGLILAGSNDCAIYGFSLDSPEPVLKLLGHSQNVCALIAGNLGTVVSGSWDKTARVWFGQKCVAILTGHSEAVWAVALLPDHTLVLTGSADKTIFLWRSNKCERKFIGHEDCVRGLAVISDSEFLSCSNDTTIRRWQTSGCCVGVYSGHTDYIYDICLSNCGEYFFSCSEDQTLRVWKQNFCVQTIHLPAKSLWALTTLVNSDIAVGGSDGTVRVFTKHESRMASQHEEVIFNEEAQESCATKRRNIGALELNDVPGAEVLLNDGTAEGQTQLCKVGSEVFVYQWSEEESKWQKLGKVLDAQEGVQPKAKAVYEGEEYDYVFTIDVADGKLLKLPYNDGDEPWHVAHNFIQKHDLNPLFLDQIANFIITNSSGGAQAESKPECSDPFTGGSRYIPSNSREALPVASSDKELPQSSSTGNVKETQSEAYFPLVSYITFDNANVSGIKAKLYEFNEKVDEHQRLSEEEMDGIIALTSVPLREVTDFQMMSLERALTWPKDLVFPALDVLRLAVRAECVNSRVSKDGAVEFVHHLLQFVTSENSASNHMLVLRTFSNSFIHSSGERLLIEQAPKILNRSSSLCTSRNKHVQIALSTLYANYTVAFQKSGKPESSICKETCFRDAVEALKNFEEPEAVLRLLVCIGTAVQGNKTYLQLAKNLQVVEIVGYALQVCGVPKVRDFATTLICLIESGI